MSESPHRVLGDAARAVGKIEHQQFTAPSASFQSHDAVAAAAGHVADETARQFLRLVLPDRGYYVGMILESERRNNVFAPTIERLWEIVKDADQAGHTAYHACASFKEARHDPRGTPPAQRKYGRTKHNVLGAKAFWLDVDAGPDKPYPDWQAAARAVAAFCQATRLPMPLRVVSGLGLHVYWPLEQILDPEMWGRYARGLKALCVKHGLNADPARTADITSVLRTPGTHHRKAGVRLVQCGELVGPYAIEQFKIFLSACTDRAPKTPPGLTVAQHLEELGPPRPHLRNEKNNRSEALLRNLSEPYFGAMIAERCEQLRALRDKQGKIREPDWYAALGVLGFCEDGDRLAHEWSSGDRDRYSEGETDERLSRLRGLSGATTCRRFHELNPAVCERCSWWTKIKSPIVLGRKDGGTSDRSVSGDSSNRVNRAEPELNVSSERTGLDPITTIRQRIFARTMRSFAPNDLNKCVVELKRKKEPGRAKLLFRKSVRLGILIARGYLDRTKAADALFNACVRNGLVAKNGEYDVRQHIERGFTYGAKKVQT
jgi:hypothetical protein